MDIRMNIPKMNLQLNKAVGDQTIEDQQLKSLCKNKITKESDSGPSFFAFPPQSQTMRTCLRDINTLHKKAYICDFLIQKSGEKFGQYVNNYVALTKNFLHMFEDKEKNIYKGSFKLEFMLTEFYMNNSSNKRFMIKFTLDCMQEEFSTKDETVFNALKKHLSKLTIQKGFDTKFSVGDLVGQGAFAEIYNGKELETGTEYSFKFYKISDFSNESMKKKAVMQEIKVMRHISDSPY